MKGLIHYECKNGYYQNRYKIFMGMGVLMFIIYIVIADIMLLNDSAVNIGDCWLYLFSGCPEYTYSSDAKFELPIFWFLFHAYLLYMVCNYPVNDLNELGLQSMILSRSREKWITGKLIWTMSIVCTFYVQTLIILMLEIIIRNKTSEQVISLNFKGIAMGCEWFVPYVLPMISDIAIAVMQMFLSFFINPFLAYIFSIIYLILSVYVKNIFLLGNYSMLLRNIRFSENGLSTQGGLISSFLFIVVISCMCMIHIRRRDVVGKDWEV